MSFDKEEFEGSEFSDVEIEAFQEISNIGVGHAATALSELLHRKVDMSIPYVHLRDISLFAEIIAGSPETIMTGILVDTVLDNKMLNYLLVFNETSTKNILRILRTSEPPDNLAELDEVGISIIQETGNILLHHVITAINSFTDSVWFPSIPQISIDMIGAMIQEVVGRENNPMSKLLQIQCDIFTEDESLKGEIFIIPNKEGLKLLMDRLYGDGWDQV
ncbi:MAG: chemotaxis protein CheC [Candidatus Heimdallarchaeota archaeon]|nr:chemotaxis protein CheC [Candidatus Heimdallarchaeota archaeon]